MQENVTFPGSRGQLAGTLHLPDKGAPRAWALFAHCFTCTRNIRAAVVIAEALCGAGIGVLRFDFTGLGRSEGEFADTHFSSNVEDLVRAADWLAEAGVGWFEEPMVADAPDEHWQQLKASVRLPLAGAENLRGFANIERAFGWLDYIQPDVGKWGGITDCFVVAQRAISAGKTYCPHWLGGGIGLLHSAQLLAAAGGDGLLEMDVNENPLRDHMLSGALAIDEGHVDLPAAAGIGVSPDFAEIEHWRVEKIALA